MYLYLQIKNLDSSDFDFGITQISQFVGFVSRFVDLVVKTIGINFI